MLFANYKGDIQYFIQSAKAIDQLHADSKDVYKRQLSTPLMVLFLIPPMFNDMNNVIASIAKFVPTTPMSNIIDAAIQGQNIFTGEFLSGFLVILIWIIMGAVIFMYMYRKRSMDN